MNGTLASMAVVDRNSRAKRASQRRNVKLLTALMSDERRLIGFAMVSNISATGAKLTLCDKICVPDRFTMALSSRADLRRYCVVVWRNSSEIGVHFLPTG